MSFLDVIPFIKKRSGTPNQIISQSWNDREEISHPANNLFVWERTLEASISYFANDVTLIAPESIRQHISKADLTNQLDKARAQWLGVSALSAHDFWVDIRQLANDFLDCAESQTGTLHLKVVSDDGCTKFHTDGYRLRLFTTYQGRGTEWLPEKAVNRQALGKNNEGIVKDVNQIQRIRTGHVSILKGELPYQKSQAKGIVHRSPALSSPAQKRLILRIDI